MNRCDFKKRNEEYFHETIMNSLYKLFEMSGFPSQCSENQFVGPDYETIENPTSDLIFQKDEIIRRAMIDTNFIHWYYVHKLFGKDILHVTHKDIMTNLLLGNIKVSDVPDIYKELIYTSTNDTPHYDIVELIEANWGIKNE